MTLQDLYVKLWDTANVSGLPIRVRFISACDLHIMFGTEVVINQQGFEKFREELERQGFVTYLRAQRTLKVSIP